MMSRAALAVSLVVAVASVCVLAGCGGERAAPPLGAGSAGDAPAAGPGKIVFSSERLPAGLYTMQPDGTGQVHVPNTVRNDEFASWSPDHTKLVFLRNSSGEICRINVAGSGLLRLTKNVRDWHPRWSPTDDKIVFSRYGTSQSHIWVMNTDGTGAKQLTSGAWYDTDASWSPDGTKIVFNSSRAGSRCLFVMNANGSHVTQLTTSAKGAYDWRPAWAPYGGSIAFARGPAGSADIYVIKPSGTGLKQLTTGTAWDTGPTWSPDSTKIAFERTPSGSDNADIHVMRATDGAILMKLTTNKSWDAEPGWSKP